MRILVLNITLFCFLILCSAQERPSYEADIRRGIKTDQEFIQELSGNVILRQGNITIQCENATYFPSSNQSILTGSVVLIQESLTMFSEKLNYDGNTKISDSPGSVRIEDGATILTADMGVYFGEPKIAEFRNNVFIEDDSVMIDAEYIRYEKLSGNSYGYGDVYIRGKFTNTKLFSDSVEYYPEKFYTLAIGEPILLQVDTTGVNPDYIEGTSRERDKYLYDTLSVSCDTMQAYRYPHDEQYVFNENVIVTKSELALKCDLGYYYKDRDFFQFTGSPSIWYGESQLYGDSIIMNITANNELKNIQCYANALMATIADSNYTNRINQIVGEYIDMKFINGEINNVTASGKSKSLYFLIDEGNPDGAIRISSDKTEIKFANDEIIDLFFTSDPPKNDGIQYPESDINQDPAAKNLPGFRWQPIRPIQKEPPSR